MRHETRRGGSSPQQRHALVTGGAGFIGTNLAHRLLGLGRAVRLYDDLSRPGAEENVRWLREVHGDRVDLVTADVGNPRALARAVRGAREVYHACARGAAEILDALSGLELPPPVIFTSTHEVYGPGDDLELAALGNRYVPTDPDIRAHGLGERRPLAPRGATARSDTSVLDEARSRGLRAVVFRLSSVYGPHQMGDEDEGWVAHFARRLAAGERVTVHGDGKQVRDLLFADDLVDAFLLVQERMTALAGAVFNVGGGPRQSASVLEIVDRLCRASGTQPELAFGPWRTGERRYYVSDIRRLQAATGWHPRVGLSEGLQYLHEWLSCSPSRLRPSKNTPRPARVAVRTAP